VVGWRPITRWLLQTKLARTPTLTGSRFGGTKALGLLLLFVPGFLMCCALAVVAAHVLDSLLAAVVQVVWLV